MKPKSPKLLGPALRWRLAKLFRLRPFSLEHQERLRYIIDRAYARQFGLAWPRPPVGWGLEGT